MASFQAMRGQGDGAVVSDDQRRRRMAEAIATALRPLRAQLSSEQQQMLDVELTLQANARRVTVYVLRVRKPAPVAGRLGLLATGLPEVLHGRTVGDLAITGELRTGQGSSAHRKTVLWGNDVKQGEHKVLAR